LDEAADVELALGLRKAKETLAVVLLTSDPGLDAGTALDAGCSVLLTQGRTIRDLVAAIRSAGRGDVTFPVEFVTRRLRLEAKATNDCLTSRELEILRLLADGVSTRQVASFLTLSCHTVRNHINNVMAKLGVHSRLEAVIAGQRLGLLVSDQTIP
jgi:DNA-binding NarL/FixJ family response regulator